MMLNLGCVERTLLHQWVEFLSRYSRGNEQKRRISWRSSGSGLFNCGKTKSNPYIIWLVVFIILKNICQWEGLFHILWKINNVWNHRPDCQAFWYECLVRNQGLVSLVHSSFGNLFSGRCNFFSIHSPRSTRLPHAACAAWKQTLSVFNQTGGTVKCLHHYQQHSKCTNKDMNLRWCILCRTSFNLHA